MRIGAFELFEPLPQLRTPHAIAVLRPWVNVGRVGTLTLSRIEQHLGAQDLGQLVRPGTFYDFTRYRPRVRYVDGRRNITIPNTLLRYAHRQEGPDLLFIHMREPHLCGEDYSQSILEVLRTFGVERYWLIGAMYDVVPHTRRLLMSGSATSTEMSDLLRNLGVQPSTYEGPTTITYLVTQEASKMGTECATVLVRLPQYVQLEEDHAGTARLMEMLGSIYQLPSSLADPEKGRRQYQELTAAVEQNPEVKQVLQQLEEQYDRNEVPSAPAPETRLSPEVERFLEELDTRLRGGDTG